MATLLSTRPAPHATEPPQNISPIQTSTSRALGGRDGRDDAAAAADADASAREALRRYLEGAAAADAAEEPRAPPADAVGPAAPAPALRDSTESMNEAIDLEAEVRARTRALELEIAKADGAIAPGESAPFHWRKPVL